MPVSARTRSTTAIAHGAWTRPPNGESTQMRQSPSSSRHALDDDRAVVGHRAGRGRLIGEVAQQVLGGARVEVVVLRRAAAIAAAGGMLRAASRTSAPMCAAELERPPGGVRLPERHLARLARRGRDEHAVVRDLLDAPGRGAEQERLADAALEDHLLVELADARAGPRSPARNTP